MAQSKRYSALRKDTKRRIESDDKPLTPLDYGIAVQSLSDKYPKEQLCRLINCTEKQLNWFLELNSLPNGQQCKRIRRILDENN